jgi:glyoxalase family protein
MSPIPASPVLGLHHVTAIAGEPAVNVAFYSEVLGQRLVKKTVNFDDPNTYHLYYGDGAGSPGTILTFFPWPGASRGSRGAGQPSVTAYAVPVGSLGFWVDRLRAERVLVDEPAERFGRGTVSLLDPDGLRLELVEAEGASDLPAWPGRPEAPVPEAAAIRGLFGVTLAVPPGSGTGDLLERLMGFERVERGGDGATRFAAPGAAGALDAFVDVVETSQQGRLGVGVVHHVAFRVADDAAQAAWRAHLESAGRDPSPVRDRNYFRSIYFREPGGVLFELATDPPGFAIDEPVESLGAELKLPPALESWRDRIEAVLPPIEPAPSGAGEAG